MIAVEEMIVAVSSIESPLLVWDIRTGKILANYKQSTSLGNSLCTVGSDHIAASQASKSGGAIFFWNWEKSNAIVKSYPNEPIVPLASTSNGTYIAGGGESGLCYIWEVSTGNLLRTWPAHLSAIECLTFSNDDSLLFSGGKDGIVNVWELSRVLSGPQNGPNAVDPLLSFSDHTQAVTALCAGSGAGANSILMSCSNDRTCKIYSLGLRACLRSVIFPVSVNCVVTDVGEYSMFAGGADGRVFVSPLISGVRVDDGTRSYVNEEEEELIGHKRAVTALVFNVDGSLLVSASEDRTVCIWCAVSRKMLRRLDHPRGPITAIIVVPRPSKLPNQEREPGSKPANGRAPAGQAIAPLKRYAVGGDQQGGQDGPRNPWEGPLVTLRSCSGDDVAARDWPSPSFSHNLLDSQLDCLREGTSLEGLQSGLEQKKDEVRRALDVAERWKSQYEQSFQVASDLFKHLDSQQRREKGREKGKGKAAAGKGAA